MKRDIVILAISDKNENYCVAGIDVHTNAWVRPYSHNSTIAGAVLLRHTTYRDGSKVKLLDVVRIDFQQNCQNIAQPENVYYNHLAKWEKIGHWPLKDVIHMHGYDKREYVFGNINKSLTAQEIANSAYKESLLILPVYNPAVVVSNSFGRKRLQFYFLYNGHVYKYFGLSDPRVKDYYANCPEGHYPLPERAIVVFSLTDAYFRDGKHYKMAATVFPLSSSS